MTAAKEFGEQLLDIFIDQFKGLFESRASFTVDFLDRRFQGFHGFFEFGVLGIQIIFALRFDLVLIDGRQINRAETINTVANQLQLLFPIHHLSIVGQTLQQSFKIAVLLDDLLFNGAT